MSDPETIERTERIERLVAALRSDPALLLGLLRRLHNEVSAWMVELEEPGRAA